MLSRRVEHLIISAIVALTLGLSLSLPAWAKKLELTPKTPQQEQACNLLLEGTRLLEAKKPFKARKVLEQSAQLWPESAGVHYNLGCCYDACALYDQAIAEFQKALQLDSKMTDCLVNIGSCYQVQGRTDEAITFFHNYLKKNSHSKDAETVQGMIHALEKYKREHIESDPASPDYVPSICDEGFVRRWPINKMPLAIYISNGTNDDGQPVQGFREEFNYILLGAINDWMKASHHRLSYRLVTDPKQADLACTWTDDPAFLHDEGNKVEQGVAQVFAETKPGTDGTKSILSAHVRILVLNRDTNAALTSDDMKKTCLHEIGHALGIVGHSPSNKDVMFYSNASAVWPALTKRDKATVLRIYQDFPEPPASAGQPPG